MQAYLPRGPIAGAGRGRRGEGPGRGFASGSPGGHRCAKVRASGSLQRRRMTLEIVRVKTGAELTRFQKLPFRLHRDDPNWVPPLLSAERRLLDRKVHPFHKHAEVEYFLALRDGTVVGRIAAIVNREHLRVHRDGTGFWGFFESEDDPEIAKGLFDQAEAFLRSQGLKGSRGPMNFSVNETCGLLVEGFDTPPYIMMTHNPPYYAGLIESAGYRKVMDLLAYHVTRDTVRADVSRPSSSGPSGRAKLSFRHMDRRRLAEEIKTVNSLFNDAWRDNWGFVPMTEEELEFMAREMKAVFEPRLSYVVEIGGEPIAFAVALPNVNPLLRKIGGRLWPLGWLKILLGRKSIDSFRVLLLGVRKDYQGSGIGFLFVMKMVRDALKTKARAAEMSWILETNRAMRAPLERIGARPYKRYRIYEKALGVDKNT